MTFPLYTLEEPNIYSKACYIETVSTAFALVHVIADNLPNGGNSHRAPRFERQTLFLSVYLERFILRYCKHRRVAVSCCYFFRGKEILPVVSGITMHRKMAEGGIQKVVQSALIMIG